MEHKCTINQTLINKQKSWTLKQLLKLIYLSKIVRSIYLLDLDRIIPQLKVQGFTPNSNVLQLCHFSLKTLK